VCSALRLERLSGGEQGFDGFVAENEEGNHRPETGQERLVAAGVADPADDVFAGLGVRSGGEGGTTPALAAVINAIVDAVAEFGVRHIEMPGDTRAGMARHSGTVLNCPEVDTHPIRRLAWALIGTGGVSGLMALPSRRSWDETLLRSAPLSRQFVRRAASRG
jgi:hypothetical protein